MTKKLVLLGDAPDDEPEPETPEQAAKRQHDERAEYKHWLETVDRPMRERAEKVARRLRPDEEGAHSRWSPPMPYAAKGR